MDNRGTEIATRESEAKATHLIDSSSCTAQRQARIEQVPATGEAELDAAVG